MDYQWMPWNVEGSCYEPYNANLSSQVVDYGNELPLGYENLSYQFAPQGYVQEPNPLYLDSFQPHPSQYPLSHYNGFECSSSFEWNGYESGIDTLNVPLESSPSLSPFEQLIAKMDERNRKMDDLLEKLKKHDESFDTNVESSSTFSNFYVGHEENLESNVLCGVEELSNENLLLKSDLSSTLLTLTPPLSQEEEHIVDTSPSTPCDEDKGSEFLDMLNDLENMSIEDLTNLLSSTDPSLVPQPSQECIIEKSSLDKVEEAPHEVEIPIQFDSEDMLIFNDLVYQVECCFIDESIYEMPWEPPIPQFSPKNLNVSHNFKGEIEDHCLELISTQEGKELGVRSNVVHELDEWVKLDFFDTMTTLSVCVKFYPVPSLVCYKRFLTCEEISFFWFRDGYSEYL